LGTVSVGCGAVTLFISITLSYVSSLIKNEIAYDGDFYAF